MATDMLVNGDLRVQDKIVINIMWFADLKESNFKR